MEDEEEPANISMIEEDCEPWKEELHDIATEVKTDIHDWKELRDQIKDDFKKKHDMLIHGECNQFVIL